MELRLRFRGWKTGAEQPAFDERVTLTERELIETDVMLRLTERHLEALGPQGGMIETEFLDEADPNRRFMRIGTDPSRMLAPIAFDLRDKGACEKAIGTLKGILL